MSQHSGAECSLRFFCLSKSSTSSFFPSSWKDICSLIGPIVFVMSYFAFLLVLLLPPFLRSFHMNVIHRGSMGRYGGSLVKMQESSKDSGLSDSDRKDLWKRISGMEKRAVQLLAERVPDSKDEAFQLLAQSAHLKTSDPFIRLSSDYVTAVERGDDAEATRCLQALKLVDLPPHLSDLYKRFHQQKLLEASVMDQEVMEEVDPGSTFSDTVTEKIRIKVSSFFDQERSDPVNGKFMFWYKVAIYNEGAEPVQVVARMWEIEKWHGEKEVVRGAGIMSTQPIIAPGDVFTYQSACPLKVFPPKGKRVLATMSGAYTMCKGNMGQHNFTAKISKFNLILPESVVSSASSSKS